MAKQIVITYEGVSYTLEFNRKTVRSMEDRGFVINTDKPATMIQDLFRGAFQMHHKRMENGLIDKIWAAQKNKEELLAALVSMYAEPISTLMDEPDGDEDETPTWKIL